jgi:hypothetical protein
MERSHPLPPDSNDYDPILVRHLLKSIREFIQWRDVLKKVRAATVFPS